MAGRRSTQPPAAAPSPDLDDETDDPQGSQASNFTLRLILDLTRGQGATTQAIRDLSADLQRQGQKLDRIDDMRVDLAALRTKLDTACDDLRQTRQKLDRVHTWVVGAAAIVAFLVVAAQIALRVWPAHEVAPMAATATTNPAQPPPR